VKTLKWFLKKVDEIKNADKKAREKARDKSTKRVYAEKELINELHNQE